MKEERGRPHKKNSDYLIRTIRKAMGLTSNQLATLTALEYYTIHRAETGLMIRPESVYKIAQALKISPDIIFYSMGQFPEDKIELIKKDPLAFKELIDGACSEPWRLTKTKDYIQSIKDKIEQTKTNPEIIKILSKLASE